MSAYIPPPEELLPVSYLTPCPLACPPVSTTTLMLVYEDLKLVVPRSLFDHDSHSFVLTRWIQHHPLNDHCDLKLLMHNPKWDIITKKSISLFFSFLILPSDTHMSLLQKEPVSTGAKWIYEVTNSLLSVATLASSSLLHSPTVSNLCDEQLTIYHNSEQSIPCEKIGLFLWWADRLKNIPKFKDMYMKKMFAHCMWTRDFETHPGIQRYFNCLKPETQHQLWLRFHRSVNIALKPPSSSHIKCISSTPYSSHISQTNNQSTVTEMVTDATFPISSMDTQNVNATDINDIKDSKPVNPSNRSSVSSLSSLGSEFGPIRHRPKSKPIVDMIVKLNSPYLDRSKKI
ncbi:MAG: hypothetical protein Sylvanvirus1_27 [Sylvanvirus sp.]|uniref:Uncharacterized protein n=1 Tax=Sylvanvirus sp. TaxID=2487774 RepID=A0A3G5AJB8_9VIRU|nr:MAG: hypothetical protein Sylvanvirus1_27 [Sylvanvirus sp.]